MMYIEERLYVMVEFVRTVSCTVVRNGVGYSEVMVVMSLGEDISRSIPHAAFQYEVFILVL